MTKGDVAAVTEAAINHVITPLTEAVAAGGATTPRAIQLIAEASEMYDVFALYDTTNATQCASPRGLQQRASHTLGLAWYDHQPKR